MAGGAAGGVAATGRALLRADHLADLSGPQDRRLAHRVCLVRARQPVEDRDHYGFGVLPALHRHRGRRQGDAEELHLGRPQHGRRAADHHHAGRVGRGAAAGVQRPADRPRAVVRRDVRRRDGVVIGRSRLLDRVRGSERALRRRLRRHHQHRVDRICRRSGVAVRAQPPVGRTGARDRGVRPVRAVRSILRSVGRYYSVFLLLAAYEAMSRFGLVSPRLFPSLVVIAEQLWKYTANGDLIYQAGISLSRALMGFGLALTVGVVLGTAMARSRFVEALIEPLFIFSYPIPKIALYPVFIFVFGLGTESKVALVFLECLYPIVIHVHVGMRSADRVLVWAARSMGASPRQIFTRVLVPASLPIVFTGLRIALPVSLIITLVTEIIGESRGLGFFVTFATSSFQYARALAAFFMIAVLGFVLGRALVFARDRIVFWQLGGAVM